MLMQDVSTMIRYKLNPIIFLINNGGYTIEVEIHDGPYNNIQNWDYSGLVQCYDNHEGNVYSTKVGMVQCCACLSTYWLWYIVLLVVRNEVYQLHRCQVACIALLQTKAMLKKSKKGLPS